MPATKYVTPQAAVVKRIVAAIRCGAQKFALLRFDCLIELMPVIEAKRAEGGHNQGDLAVAHKAGLRDGIFDL